MKGYKTIGWILIILGIILAILNLYFSWCTTCSTQDLIYEVGFGFLFSALIFVLSFFPGKFYLKVDEDKENKLVKSSLVLIIIAIFILLLGILIGFISCGGSCDPLAIALPVVSGVILAGVLYGVSILLIIINWFRNKH